MAEVKNYITPTGFDKLRQEYTELLNGERPKLVLTVAWAASNGDRSENADYIYGKRRLREIDKRLHFLQKKMQASEVIDPKNLKSKTIIFGATVTVENNHGQEITYRIVGEDEIDIPRGFISWQSPVAKALLGKKVDDEAIIKKPTGEESITILSIHFE